MVVVIATDGAYGFDAMVAEYRSPNRARIDIEIAHICRKTGSRCAGAGNQVETGTVSALSECVEKVTVLPYGRKSGRQPDRIDFTVQEFCLVFRSEGSFSIDDVRISVVLILHYFFCARRSDDY